jgi:hypothetical protein
MVVVAPWTWRGFSQRRRVGRWFCGAIGMHGADGFASAFEEAQKLPLGKVIAGLSVRIYRILQVSALSRESERCGEAER